MLKNYLKIALRNIKKQKVFSVINILGFAFSLTICLLAIQLIDSMHSSDRFHEKKDRIYTVNCMIQGINRIFEEATAPLPLADELSRSSSVERVVRIKRNLGGSAVYGEKILQVQGLYVDDVFFDVFSYELESGNPAGLLSDPYSIVLTRELASKFFGPHDPIGEVLRIEPSGEFTVTGVLKDISKFKSHMRFDLLASASTLISLENQKKIEPCLTNWDRAVDTYVYFLIREDSSLDPIELLLSEIVEKHYYHDGVIKSFRLQALTDISPGRNMSSPLTLPIPPEFTFIVSLLTCIIILVTCFNYTHLSLAKGLNRAREVGIRKVNGASRFDLFRQFVGEAVIISFIALGLAYIFLHFLVSAFNRLYGSYYYLRNESGMSIYPLFILCTIGMGILSGFVPALLLSRFNPVLVLKDVTKVKLFSRLTLRKALIVVQFCICLIFIITIGVGYQQVQFERNYDSGIETDHIINVELQDVDFNAFKQEISNYAGISNVSASFPVPNTGEAWGAWARRVNSPDSMRIHVMSISRNFMENIGLKLIAGRHFPEGASSGNELFAILNETAVKQFGFGTAVDALGQSIDYKGEINLEVIGVIKDFSHLHLQIRNKPLVLRNNPKYFRNANIKISDKDVDGTLLFLETKWKELDPAHPFKVAFYKDQVEFAFTIYNTALKTIGFIALSAIFIAFFGLLGMVIYDAEARVKEIGIRKVMGARVSDVVRVTSKRFIVLLFIATTISIPVTWFLNSAWLQFLPFRIQLGFGPFLFGILFIFTVACTIIFPKTIKAARANPVDSLRYE